MTQLIIYGLVLSLGALLSGLLAIRLISGKRSLNFLLVFTGGYLFSITIVHMLPEIYGSESSPFVIGIMVLTGFFLQQLLEFLTAGVEHGHMHELSGHSKGKFFAPTVVIALCIHALLEGGILVQENMQSVLAGITLHKIPAAIALVVILKQYSQMMSGKLCSVYVYLVIFALASPLGMWLGYYIPEELEVYLMALVGGNFLQISTTIVFENTADHKFNIRKIVYSLLGAFLAIASEILFF